MLRKVTHPLNLCSCMPLHFNKNPLDSGPTDSAFAAQFDMSDSIDIGASRSKGPIPSVALSICIHCCMLQSIVMGV